MAESRGEREGTMAASNSNRSPILLLPTELQLKIADILNDPRDTLHLRRLTLTCRELRPVAQEALHRSIALKRPRQRDEDRLQPYSSVIWAATERRRIMPLIRTLIERPDLRASVKTLELCVTSNTFGHAFTCDLLSPPILPSVDSRTPGERMSLCSCERGAFYLVVSRFLNENRTLYWDEAWLHRLVCMRENAWCGLLLTLLPNLHTLKINPQDYSIRGIGGRTNDVGLPYQSDSGHNYWTSNVPGMKRLQILITSAAVPPIFLKAPKLQIIRMGVIYGDEWRRYIDPHSPVPLLVSNFSTTSLTFDLETRFMRRLSNNDQGRETMLRTTLRSLRALKRLHIKIFCTCRTIWEHTAPPGHLPVMWNVSYQILVEKIQSESVENLVINNSCQCHCLELPITALQTIRPLQQLASSFPNLKTFVAPQEAFLYVGDAEELENHTHPHPVMQMPSTLESVGILDSTRAIKKWACELLLAKSAGAFQSLTKIELWRQWRGGLLESDTRLRVAVESSEGTLGCHNGVQQGELSEATDTGPLKENEEWQCGFMVPDNIWDGFKEVGVDVIRHGQGTFEDHEL